MSESSDPYIIRSGRAGADRLAVLARATWPTSRNFLQRAGLRPGVRCLEIGCGPGAMSSRLWEGVAPSGSVLGLDRDPEVIDIARTATAASGGNIRFEVADVTAQGLAAYGEFDLAYVRFVLSHLPDPVAALRNILPALRPGAAVAVEDVDFPGHFCHPPSRAFERYVELYQASGQRRGSDPCIGPRLLSLLRQVGLRDVSVGVALPTFADGEGKWIVVLTLEAIRESLVADGLASDAEIDTLLEELERDTRDPNTIMSLPRIFQVHGTVPGR